MSFHQGIRRLISIPPIYPRLISASCPLRHPAIGAGRHSLCPSKQILPSSSSSPLLFTTHTSRSRSYTTMAQGNYELFCLENPLLDIQAQGDKGLLEKYGLKDNDAILAEEKHMGIYEELMKKDAKLIPGGAAQNTARGAQYMLPPDSVVYVGCVGKDKEAEILEKASKEAGVRVEYKYDDKEPTGRCGVVITGLNRSLCTSLAAANCYKLEHLKSEKIWSLAEKAQVYYVGGFHLTVCPPAMMALGEEAASKNKILALNLSAPFIPQFFAEPLDKLIPYVDTIICNESEASAYAASHSLADPNHIESIASHLALLPKVNTKRPRTVIISQGTDPAIVAIANAGATEPDMKKFEVHPIGQDKIVDTNGAGDAFAGGYMAGIVQGKSLEDSIHQGMWLAKLGIQELGPSYPYPKKQYNGTEY